MPIRPELKHYYGAQWRKQIRPRILERDGHKCRFCRKPNHVEVLQIVDAPRGRMWWLQDVFRPGEARERVQWLRDQRGIVLSWDAEAELPLRNPYKVKIVLTVAHLNHDPSDMREDNLAALCQWCHLHYDQQHHAATRAKRKDQARPILVCAGAEYTPDRNPDTMETRTS